MSEETKHRVGQVASAEEGVPNPAQEGPHTLPKGGGLWAQPDLRTERVFTLEGTREEAGRGQARPASACSLPLPVKQG